VNSALDECKQQAAALGVESIGQRFESLRSRLADLRGIDVLAWLRRKARASVPGSGVAHNGFLHEALLALVAVVDPTGLELLPQAGPLRSKQECFDLVVAVGHASASDVATEANRRVEQYRVRGLLAPSEAITVVCSGNHAGLAAYSQLPIDIIGGSDGDVLGGGPVTLLDAHLVLEEAA
jgi:hypothetical protein